jgi:aspartyl-tRNA(Asn)/glutamyl-tRNA(Gln) amidotransferase subunit C
MAVSVDDVQHIAELACIGLDPERVRSLVAELNAILDHMQALSRIDTSGVEAAVGVGAAGTPLRVDERRPPALARSPEAFAPSMRDGFFLVPRLSTHETAEAEG